MYVANWHWVYFGNLSISDYLGGRSLNDLVLSSNMSKNNNQAKLADESECPLGFPNSVEHANPFTIFEAI